MHSEAMWKLPFPAVMSRADKWVQRSSARWCSKVQLLWWFYCVVSKRLAYESLQVCFRLWVPSVHFCLRSSSKSIFSLSVNYSHRLVSFQCRFSCNVIPVENTKENRKPSPCKCTR